METKGCGYDENNFEGRCDTSERTEDGKERVDVFGDSDGQNDEDGYRTARLPVKYSRVTSHGAEQPHHRSSVAYMLVTVLLLTTAFAALACTALAGAGKDPRTSIGKVAGSLIFGVAGNADDTRKAEMPASVTDAPGTSPAEDTVPGGENGSAGASVTEKTQATNPSSEPSVTTAPVTEAGTRTEDTAAATDASDAPTDTLYKGLVDKTGRGVSLDSLVAAFGAEVTDALKGKNVLVVCTHPSEKFSDGAPVTDAAAAFCQALGAVGIGTKICDGGFDLPGRLGSYSRARAAIEKELGEGDFGLVLDIHLGAEPELTVGTSADGWERNAALAAILNKKLDTYGVNVTVDNGRYNQDLPVLSVHVVLDAGEKSSRGLKNARILADAVIRTMK